MAFAILGLFLSIGFFFGMIDSEALITSVLRTDFILFNGNTRDVGWLHEFNPSLLYRLGAEDWVAEVVPVYQTKLGIKDPDSKMVRMIQCFAFPADAEPFDLPGFSEERQKLKGLRTILYDSGSRPVFGRIETGMHVEVDHVLMRVAGTVNYGANFSNNGTIFMSDATLRETSSYPRSRIHLGLLRIKPGVHPEKAERKLRAILSDDLELRTRDSLWFRELVHAVTSTPIGGLLAVCLVVSVFVGITVIYQILYTQILDHIANFATMNAMGFSTAWVNRVVRAQAFQLSLLGFLPGVLAAHLIYLVIGSLTWTKMVLTIPRILGVYLLTLCMCLLAARVAVGRAVNADPAELY